MKLPNYAKRYAEEVKGGRAAIAECADILSASEGVEFDLAEAIYWTLCEWHGGQSSAEYSILSTMGYTPGPSQNGPERDSLAAMLYDILTRHMEQSHNIA